MESNVEKEDRNRDLEIKLKQYVLKNSFLLYFWRQFISTVKQYIYIYALILQSVEMMKEEISRRFEEISKDLQASEKDYKLLRIEFEKGNKR